MQERVQRLEALRLSLEEELSRMKAAVLSERSQAEEELIKAKNQARLEERGGQFICRPSVPFELRLGALHV